MDETTAIQLLKEQQESGDVESIHYEADNILCKFLISLGYEKVVEEYDKIYKWYG